MPVTGLRVNNSSANGFTIVELGAVIMLIALMVIILSPFVKLVRDQAHKIKCIHNVQMISIALREYAIQSDTKLPEELISIYKDGYLYNEKFFDCPFTKEKGTALNPEYVYVKGADYNSAENPVLLYDKKTNHPDGTINVLYLNGEIVTKKSSLK